MSTIADMGRLLQPYVDRHDDLVLVGRAVVIKPVHHLLRGFFVDRTSSKNWVKPFWFAQLMFTPWAIMGFDWTGRRYPEHADLDNEATQAAIFQDMDTAFAELRGILDQCSAYGVQLEVNRKLQDFSFYRGIIRAAEGDFQQAVEDLSEYVAGEEAHVERELEFIERHTRQHSRRWHREMYNYNRSVAYLKATKELVALLETHDARGIANLLREWERGTAKAWRIEHLWEPTPFPFE